MNKEKANVLLNILPETILAVDHVGSFLRIHRKHLLRAFVTRALVELSLAPERHALFVTTRWAMVRQRKLLLLIEDCLLRNNIEILAALFVRADEFDRSFGR
jgi:hypothetical protein